MERNYNIENDTKKDVKKVTSKEREKNIYGELFFKVIAIVYMVGLTGVASYYISNIFYEEMWENERWAITLFIAVGFLITLVYFVRIEKSIIGLLFIYHFLLIGTVICSLLPVKFMPFMLMPLVATAIYDKKAGLLVSVTVSIVLHIGFMDYPMVVFSVIPSVVCVASCFAVWKNGQFISNILGVLSFVATELVCLLIFKHYSEGTGMEYESVGFIVVMVIFGVAIIAVGNLIAIIANWFIWNRVPSFYLDKISNDKYEAVRFMKNKSTSLYYHSTEVAELARLAARRINADESLAYAGGIYHDLGKTTGTEYIKEGLVLAAKYGLPKSVRAIMIEHNVKARLPKSKEAAIVMLCDTAISAVEYLKGTMDKKDMSEKSIIENALNKRLTTGTLHMSTLSIEEFEKIKEVLIKIKEQQ